MREAAGDDELGFDDGGGFGDASGGGPFGGGDEAAAADGERDVADTVGVVGVDDGENVDLDEDQVAGRAVGVGGVLDDEVGDPGDAEDDVVGGVGVGRVVDREVVGLDEGDVVGGVGVGRVVDRQVDGPAGHGRGDRDGAGQPVLGRMVEHARVLRLGGELFEADAEAGRVAGRGGDRQVGRRVSGGDSRDRSAVLVDGGGDDPQVVVGRPGVEDGRVGDAGVARRCEGVDEDVGGRVGDPVVGDRRHDPDHVFGGLPGDDEGVGAGGDTGEAGEPVDRR